MFTYEKKFRCISYLKSIYIYVYVVVENLQQMGNATITYIPKLFCRWYGRFGQISFSKEVGIYNCDHVA